jgi:hypothetical protein
MANGTFKMKMDIDRHGPDLCPTTVKILTHLISRYQRYQLPLRRTDFGPCRLMAQGGTCAPINKRRVKFQFTLFIPISPSSFRYISVSPHLAHHLRTYQKEGMCTTVPIPVPEEGKVYHRTYSCTRRREHGPQYLFMYQKEEMCTNVEILVSERENE